MMKHLEVGHQIFQLIVIILYLNYSFATDTNKDNYICTLLLNNTYQSTNCILMDDNHHLKCLGNYYNNNKIEYPIELSELVNLHQYDYITTLTICNGSESHIDPYDIINKFPNLNTLMIINGNLTTITTEFPSEAELHNIYIIGTQLHSLPNNVFKYLSSLRILDLRNNSLTEINPDDINDTSIDRIYLFGNPWKCDYKISWILNMDNNSLARKIYDREQLYCSVPYNGRPLVPIVEIISTLKNECNRTICDCELIYVVVQRNLLRQMNKRRVMAFVSVNCSYRGLEVMPEFIPENTTRLYLTGNKISNLAPLVSNNIYRQVHDLFLDDNLIESIAQLEGNYWFEHFRAFSLRGNKLTDLPTYALGNALVQNENAVSLYLGNNPWTCDCHFTPGFQDLLIRYTNLIKDVHDVKCHTVSDDNCGNSGKIIRDLTRTEICIIPNDDEYLLHPLDILNIILASLIILIIGKLIYDYWVFKRTGKLPWIVTKIP